MDNLVDQLIDDFHAHVDVCIRCSTSPFNLCLTGRNLLELAAKAGVSGDWQPEQWQAARAETFPLDPGAAHMVAGPTNEELFGPGPRVLIGGRRGPAFTSSADFGNEAGRVVVRCVCLREFTSVGEFNLHVSRDHGQITKPMLERRGELLGVEGDELGQGRR